MHPILTAPPALLLLLASIAGATADSIPDLAIETDPDDPETVTAIRVLGGWLGKFDMRWTAPRRQDGRRVDWQMWHEVYPHFGSTIPPWSTHWGEVCDLTITSEDGTKQRNYRQRRVTEDGSETCTEPPPPRAVPVEMVIPPTGGRAQKPTCEVNHQRPAGRPDPCLGEWEIWRGTKPRAYRSDAAPALRME